MSKIPNPNMTLKMGCKALYYIPHSPSLKADIKYSWSTAYRFILCVGADCSGPSAEWCTATAIHPAKGSAMATFPTQNSRMPLGIQQHSLHHTSFPGSKEHI